MPFISSNDRIYKVSDPDEVQRKAYQLIGHNATIYRSNRLHKKYAMFDELKRKWVHFGDIRYSDYTKTHDNDRRKQFRERNYKWRDYPIDSPAYLAYWLLW